MKLVLSILTFTLLVTKVSNLFGVNQPPQILNLSVVADTINKAVKLEFDVRDFEGDSVIVTLRASSDNGETFLLSTSQAIGDINRLISPGKGKKIVWAYRENFNSTLNLVIKVIVKDRFQINIHDIVSEVDEANLRNKLIDIYGERNHRNKKTVRHLTKVKDILEGCFTASSLQTYRQKASQEIAYPIENIIGRKAGLKDESKTYILCAHFDTAPKSPGGDDNGSGVSGMLEVMRILSKYNFDYSIKFIGFDYEEQGMGGSYMYNFYGGVKEYEQHLGAINFDMIGFFSDKANTQIIPAGFEEIFPAAVENVTRDSCKGNFAVCTSNTPSLFIANEFERCTKRYVSGLKLITLQAEDNVAATPTLANSDHVSFWSRGRAAIQIGDAGETRNVFLDTKKDVISNVSYPFMSDIVKATVATLFELLRAQNSTFTVARPIFK